MSMQTEGVDRVDSMQDGLSIGGDPIPFIPIVREPLKEKRCWLFRRPILNERPNICFIGLRGWGKTLNAVHYLVPRLRSGVRVLANVEVVDYATGYAAQRIESWDEIVDPVHGTVVSDCIVFVDEAPLWLDATQWHSVPGALKTYFRQSRKDSVGLIMTAQNWMDVAKPLRDLFDYVVVCQKVGHFLIPRRFPLYSLQTAYPSDFNELDGSLSHTLPRVYRFVPANTFSSYETEFKVTHIDLKSLAVRYRDALLESESDS